MFDLDNTLADRAAAVASWIEEFCASQQLASDARAWIGELDQDGYSSRRAMFEALRDRFAVAASTDALMEAYRMRVIELIRPLPGAVETLSALRGSGCRLAIVTNGSASQQHAKIDALGLRSMVDVVCVSAELGYAKPDPRMFRRAAELTGCSITDAWMVGDSATNDVVGAAMADARTVWVRRGRSWPDSERHPDVVIDSLHELPEILTPHSW